MVRVASVAKRRLACRVIDLLVAGLVAVGVAACGGGGGGDGGNSGNPPASGAAPTILSQPKDLNIVEGSTATFTVAAGGTGPLTYQWASSANGASYTDIAGANGSTFTIAAITLAQTGTRYRVVVSNGGGSITSSGVMLNVTAAPMPPVITVQPADVTVPASSSAVFHVTATGSTPVYLWQVSTDGGTSYTAVPGASSSDTLTVANTTPAHNGYRYRVQLLNAAGSVTSAAALLTVTGTPLAPAFTSRPSNLAIVVGQSASFTASASGAPTPTLQWLLSSNNLANGVIAAGPCSGAVVSGATTTTLTLTSVPLSCSGSIFTVMASNGTAPNAFSSATLSVSAVAAPLMIMVQPQAQTVLTGATATFSVTAVGTAVTYQWQRDGVNIVGATSSSYTTSPVAWSDSGAYYSVVVSNASGSLQSDLVRLDLMLSNNQQIAEDFALSPGTGTYRFRWNLNYMGPETSGLNYAGSEFSTFARSPLTNGPQTVVQSALVNLTTTLPLVPVPPRRFLRNGAVLVVSSAQASSITTYVGSDIRVDYLATDNTTVAFSHLRTNYTKVALTGLMPGSTDDFAHYHNSFYSNPAILKAGSTYLPGSFYVKYFATEIGDRYNVYDCGAATTDANISPCLTGTTLTAALTSGIVSTQDGTTYTLADGTIRTIGGVQIWVATAPRPIFPFVLSTTPYYRIYFQLNGNVYTGSLVTDGSPDTESYYVSNPAGATNADRITLLPFHVRMNKAARDSVAAAMAL